VATVLTGKIVEGQSYILNILEAEAKEPKQTCERQCILLKYHHTLSRPCTKWGGGGGGSQKKKTNLLPSFKGFCGNAGGGLLVGGKKRGE